MIAELEAMISSGHLAIEDIFISFSHNQALDPETWLPIAALYGYPDYTWPTGLAFSDIGIIEMQEPVEGIELAQVAPVGFLDGLWHDGILSAEN